MKSLVVLILMTSIAFGYHEFQTPKKAYKKATIEYFSNENKKTEPDSTVTIYYDRNDVEMYRQVKNGCSNVIDEIDQGFWTTDGDSLVIDSANFIDLMTLEIK